MIKSLWRVKAKIRLIEKKMLAVAGKVLPPSEPVSVRDREYYSRLYGERKSLLWIIGGTDET